MWLWSGRNGTITSPFFEPLINVTHDVSSRPFCRTAEEWQPVRQLLLRIGAMFAEKPTAPAGGVGQTALSPPPHPFDNVAPSKTKSGRNRRRPVMLIVPSV